jgi:branched-chain amino acid transport system permease protein
MADTLAQALLNGILIGGVYAIISVGLALVFGVMDIVNFAQADFLMVGMYVAFACKTLLGVDPILAAPLVFLAVFALGAITQRLLVRPILKAPMVNQIFLTVGLSLVLVSVSQLLFGADFRSVTTPYQLSVVRIGALKLSVPYVLAFAASAVLAGGLWLFLERTDFGRMMRATAQNRTAAVLVGIDPDRVHLVAFSLGVGLAGVAGAVILPYAYVFPTIGHNYALIMFTVVVLGGLGSIAGAAVAGVVVGVIHSASAALLPSMLQSFVVYVVFLATLMLRPAGLFKR